MKNIQLLISVCVIALSHFSYANAIDSKPIKANWKQTITEVHGQAFTSIKFNPISNELYLLYDDVADTNIMQINGDKSKIVGSKDFSNTENNVSDASFTLNPKTHELYTMYFYDFLNTDHDNNKHGINIMKFDGKSWASIGKFEQAQYGSIVFNPKDEIPYIAYLTDKSMLKVLKFAQNKWQLILDRKIVDSYTYKISALAIDDQTGKLYIAYTEKKFATKVIVFDGKNWAQVASLISPADQVSIAIDTDTHNPYLTYMDPNKLADIKVKQFNGKDWESVGEVNVNFNVPQEKELAIKGLKIYFNPINKKPYLAFWGWQNKDGVPATAGIKTFDGKTWQDITEQLILTTTPSVLPSLAFSKNGQLYISYITSWDSKANKLSEYNTYLVLAEKLE